MIKINNLMLGNVLAFIFVFFSIFGMKIAYFDLSIFIPCSIVLLYLANRPLLNFDGKLLVAAGLVATLLSYQTIIQLIYHTFDFDSLLRLVRALLVCILLAVVVGCGFFSRDQILSAVFYSLLLHVFMIDAAALFYPLNDFLSSISGNEKIRPLRASGLLAGFDIAGLLCLLGLLMLLLKIHIPNSIWKLIIFCFVFVLGSFFTSRVSMAILLIFLGFFFLVYIFDKKTKSSRKFLLVPVFMISGYIFIAEYLIPIVEVTFTLGIFDVSNILREEIISRHAVQSSESFLWSDMLYLPNSFVATVFGTGSDELQSDVGYVKDIFRYGIVGMIFSFLIYYYLYSIGRGFLRLSCDKNYLLLLRIVFVLVFILTFKNNYFFTRAIFPVILLLVCIPIVRRGRGSSMKSL
jgi:hypothetical protein